VAAAVANYVQTELSDRMYRLMRFRCNAAGCTIFINNDSGDEPKNKSDRWKMKIVGIAELKFGSDSLRIQRTMPTGDYDGRDRIVGQYVDNQTSFEPIVMAYSDPKMFDKLEDAIIKAYNAWFL